MGAKNFINYINQKIDYEFSELPKFCEPLSYTYSKALVQM